MEHHEIKEELEKHIEIILMQYSDDLGVPDTVYSMVEVIAMIAKRCAPSEQVARDLITDAINLGMNNE